MVDSASDVPQSMHAARNADGPEAFGAVSAINKSWSCPSCGVNIAGTPPDHRLCPACLADLQSLGYEPAPGAPYGDLPPCEECGGPMVEVVPVLQPPDPELDRRRGE
jgi:hypothetical protein